MFREALTYLRALRFRSLAEKVRAFHLLLVVAGATIGLGCSGLPDGGASDSGSPTSINDGSLATDGDAPITPSGIDTASTKELAIDVAPLFCCDPLTIDLIANDSESGVAQATFQWDLGTGHILRGPTLRHTFPWPGTYTIKLTAILPDGTTRTAQRDVTVGNSEAVPPDGSDSAFDGDEVVEPSAIVGPALPDGNAPPATPAVLLAAAGADREVQAGELVWLDGTQSKGTLPRGLRYYWKQADGPHVSLLRTQAATTSFVAPRPEEVPVVLAFELVVTEQNVVSSDSVRITVMPPPRPVVVADAGDDQTVPGGWAVQLDGGDSRSTSSQPMNFVWKQLGGPTVELATPTEISTSFFAPPDGDAPITLLFELTVATGTLVNKDTVAVVVQRPEGSDLSYNQKILAWMKELEPLPKIHITWPIPRVVLHGLDEGMLFEYARITHSLAIYGEYGDQAYMRKIVETCQRVNDTNPEIPCTLSVLLRPWLRILPVDAPVTYRGPEYYEEIQFIEEQLAKTKALLVEANQYLGASVTITCVFLDVERFFVRGPDQPDAEEWNTALDEIYNVIYDVIKVALPDARVEWYGRAISGLFTLREKGDSYSVPLYQIDDRDTTRRVYWRAYREAVLHNVSEVTPWLSLGTSYLYLPSGEKVWSFENISAISLSWQLGAEINDPWYADRASQFAPYHAAKYVIFWPNAFDERVPDWGRHFVAYVRGAHAITEIPR